MNAQRKAGRAATIAAGLVCLMALSGCGQSQVIRETVVVVATATAIAPATAPPAATAQPAEISTPDIPTSTPETLATATPQATATLAEPTLAPTQAPAVTEAPTQAATLAPTQAPTEAPTQAATLAPTQAATLAPTQAPVQPTVAPPTAEPTAEPTALPIAWGDLPVLQGAPLLPADGQLIAIKFNPVTFLGPTQPASVRFQITDPAGQQVFDSTDNSAPWCLQADLSAGCSSLLLSNGKWPGGKPALAGVYTLRMTAVDALQRASSMQTQFSLNYDWGALPALGSIGIAPQGAGGLMVSLRASPVVFAGASPARVVFTVLDPNGNLVFERVDGDSPWCAFGDADTVSNCKALLFDKPVWPDGMPVTLGKHILRIRAEDAQGGAKSSQVAFDIELLPVEASEPQPEKPTLPKLTVVVPPQKNAPLEELVPLKRARIRGDLDMQLFYPEKARGSLMIYLTAKRPGAAANGEGVGRIEFDILDANGNVVNREEESTPAFCAFGGNDPCNAITLKQGAVWPSTGIPISTGPYTVQVSVWGKDKSDKLTGPWRGRAKFDVIVPGQN